MTVEASPTLPVYMPATPGYRKATAVFDTFAPMQPDEAGIADCRWQATTRHPIIRL